MSAASKIIPITAGVFIVLSIIIGLIVGSFSYLHYYEIGLRRQSSTGFIYTDKVYDKGRYFIGPASNFKVYPATAQFMSLYSTPVFTKNKLTIYVDVHFEYFIRSEQLAWLHQDHELDYNSVIKKKATAAMKDAAVEFETMAFYKNRSFIETRLFKAVRERLGGECCQRDCEKYFDANCNKDCEPYATCKKEQSGTFVDVRYFHLGTLQMPESVHKLCLRALTAKELSLTENFKQRTALELKQTKKEVEEIRNTRNEVAKNASAQANLLFTQSQASAKRIVEEAHSNGLKNLLDGLGLSTTEQKLSYHYLNSLKASGKALYTVDYSNLVLAGKP